MRNFREAQKLVFVAERKVDATGLGAKGVHVRGLMMKGREEIRKRYHSSLVDETGTHNVVPYFYKL